VATKKAKAKAPLTVVDDDGYETDGMYRWGGPNKPFTEGDMKEWCDGFNREYTQSASDRIAVHREYLTKVILCHADGPHTREVAEAFYDRTITFLNLSSGSGIYALHENVPKRGYVEDAMVALRELDSLVELIAKEPTNIDQIVRSSIRAGLLIQRTHLRAAFASSVLTTTRRRPGCVKGGKATAQWTDNVDKEAREIFAVLKRSRMKDTPAYTRTSAKLKELGHDFSPSTVRRWLKKSSNAKR
jgi:hypothetical protein